MAERHEDRSAWRAWSEITQVSEPSVLAEIFQVRAGPLESSFVCPADEAQVSAGRLSGRRVAAGIGRRAAAGTRFTGSRSADLGTLEAVDLICRRWNLAGRRVSYGGLKDRHALTIQYLTIFDGPSASIDNPALLARAPGKARSSLSPGRFPRQSVRTGHPRPLCR